MSIFYLKTKTGIYNAGFENISIKKIGLMIQKIRCKLVFQKLDVDL